MRELGPSVRTLSSLKVGALTLTPTFSPSVVEYSVATENASNKVTAVATDSGDIITCKLGDVEFTNDTSVSWAEGANTVTIKVTDRDDATAYTTYTVTVTYTPGE